MTLDPLALDARARARIAEDLTTTFFVEASAGTGKTTALVGRIVAILKDGAGTLDRFVAVTFTDKAAGEMKLRLRSELERARQAALAGSKERDAIDLAMRQLETARIGTIHSLCADLLRERPLEAGVDPLFELGAGEDTAAIFDAVFEEWFRAALVAPTPGVARVLRRRQKQRGGIDKGADGARNILRQAAFKLTEHPDFPAPWRRDPFDRDQEASRVVEELRPLAALGSIASNPSDFLAKNLAVLAQRLRELEYLCIRADGSWDYDMVETLLRELKRESSWKWRGYGKMFAPGISKNEVIARRDALRAFVDRFVEAADADLASRLHEELLPLVELYTEAKLKAGRIDFLDLLLRARDLLRGNIEVRASFQARFDHVFIDEFQDTDPLQAEVLMLLAASDPSVQDWRQVKVVPGKLFVVGDPKQSIYRFRRSDVSLYETIKARLCSEGAEVLYLQRSFRAVPSLHKLVNAAFEPVMKSNERRTQAEYVPLVSVREDVAGQPAVVALAAPHVYSDYGKVVNWVVEESYPDAVGAFCDWLVNSSGWKVSERGGSELVPIAARHICFLFKRMQSFGEDVVRPYIRALEARRLPHVLVGGRSFFSREEVLALRNLLHAIEWPTDEFSVYAVLRGPFLAITDDVLFAYRHVYGPLHPTRKLDPDTVVAPNLEPVRDALELLRRLHRGRNRRPISDTVEDFLVSTRAHAGIAIWPTGEQALANVLRVLDLARRFESRGALSFRAFVDWFDTESVRGEAQEAPVIEDGTDGIRMMTAHRSKGLEFPVVILCDPTAKRSAEKPSRWTDNASGLWCEPIADTVPIELLEKREEVRAIDDEEGVRLAYVAATRARDVLVVPVVGIGDTPESWVDVLYPAVYPDPTRRRQSLPAPGCPAFREESFAPGPNVPESASGQSVRPGLHTPRVGEHKVVFWDPNVLSLGAEHSVGLRQEKLLTTDETGRASSEGLRNLEKWNERRASLLSDGARTRLAARAVTRVAHEDEVQSGPIEVVSVRAALPAARGARLGSLFHATAALVDASSSTDEVRRVATTEALILGAMPLEIEDVVTRIAALFENPFWQRVRNATAVRRETPISLRLDDGALAEGTLDLAFSEQRGDQLVWTIVDFKTDEPDGAALETYRRQLTLYMQAVARSTGVAVEGVLLLV